ncbi:MAG: DUF1722 domain-containing protein [bacterium]
MTARHRSRFELLLRELKSNGFTLRFDQDPPLEKDTSKTRDIHFKTGYPVYDTEWDGLIVDRNIGAGIHDRLPEEDIRAVVVNYEELTRGHVLRQFLETLYGMYRLKEFLKKPELRMNELYSFQARNKYSLMAHSSHDQKELGRLLSRHERADTILDRYVQGYRQTVFTKTSRGKHFNVLEHLQGHLPDNVSSRRKSTIDETLEKYRLGLTPWVVPYNQIRNYFLENSQDWLDGQTYLNPYSEEYALKRSASLQTYYDAI